VHQDSGSRSCQGCDQHPYIRAILLLSAVQAGVDLQLVHNHCIGLKAGEQQALYAEHGILDVLQGRRQPSQARVDCRFAHYVRHHVVWYS
jgi:hypothetical protein